MNPEGKDTNVQETDSCQPEQEAPHMTEDELKERAAETGNQVANEIFGKMFGFDEETQRKKAISTLNQEQAGLEAGCWIQTLADTLVSKGIVSQEELQDKFDGFLINAYCIMKDSVTKQIQKQIEDKDPLNDFFKDPSLQFFRIMSEEIDNKIQSIRDKKNKVSESQQPVETETTEG